MPAISVLTTGGRRADCGILAAWPDGTVVWSDDLLHGGPPYRMARIGPADVAAVVARLRQAGPRVGEWHVAPDARWTRITVRDGADRIVDAGSSHELIEADPSLVATAVGSEPLSGRRAADVLARQPADYRAFRTWWETAKSAALDLIAAAAAQAGPADPPHVPWQQ